MNPTMAKVLDYNATILRRDEVTQGLDIFHVEVDAPLERKPDLDQLFRPGQYVTIGLNRPNEEPEDPRPLSVLRPMTIASPPEWEGSLEFYIQYVEKAESRLPLTHLLWSLDVGSRIFVRPSATGRFTESDTFGDLGGRKLVMVAGGTGLAPFISLLRSKAARDPDVRLDDHILLHGVNSPSFLGYQDEIERLVAQHGLRFLPTMSRRHESGDWQGSFGKVEQLLDDQHIQDTEAVLELKLDPDQAVVMVCGLAPTIGATIRHLLARGFAPEHRRIRKFLDLQVAPSLFFEQYDADPLFDLKDEAVVQGLSDRWARSGRSRA